MLFENKKAEQTAWALVAIVAVVAVVGLVNMNSGELTGNVMSEQGSLGPGTCKDKTYRPCYNLEQSGRGPPIVVKEEYASRLISRKGVNSENFFFSSFCDPIPEKVKTTSGFRGGEASVFLRHWTGECGFP